MVRAILEGRKTMTRRPLKISKTAQSILDKYHVPIRSRYGDIGDRLWVKETYQRSTPDMADGIVYRADELLRWFDGTDLNAQEKAGKLLRDGKWKPSIFMPRWASRILLEVVNVKVERLQDITEEDAIKEGVIELDSDYCRYTFDENLLPRSSVRAAFESLWESINGKDKVKCWDTNPWVWVIEFRRVE